MDEEKHPKLYRVVRVVCMSDEEVRKKAHAWRMNPFTLELLEAFEQLSKELKKDGYSLSGIFGDKVIDMEDDYVPIGHCISFLKKK
jgi:hypothetical protein